MASRDSDPDRWWQGGVFYQIYPRSFADTNGDGVGDLRGHHRPARPSRGPGVSGVWLSPVTLLAQPRLGLRRLGLPRHRPRLRDARRPRHAGAPRPASGASGSSWTWCRTTPATSTRGSSTRSAVATRRTATTTCGPTPSPTAGPPNNWMSIFGGPAWELDEASGQYFLHNFEAAQPDLNWWSEDVRREFDDIVRFWWDRGVAGLPHRRVQHDDQGRGAARQPARHRGRPARPAVHGRAVRLQHRPARGARHPAPVADHRGRLRRPSACSSARPTSSTLETLAQFYGSGRDELHGGFNFVFINAPFEAAALRTIVEGTEALIPDGAWPIWTGSNHDVSRLATRWCGGDPAKVQRGPAHPAHPARHARSSTRATRSG